MPMGVPQAHEVLRATERSAAIPLFGDCFDQLRRPRNDMGERARASVYPTRCQHRQAESRRETMELADCVLHCRRVSLGAFAPDERLSRVDRPTATSSG